MNIKNKNIFLVNKLPFNLSKAVLYIKNLFIINLSRFNKLYLLNIIDSHIIHYPTPITLTYAWSFGALAGICLIIQMFSGIFLSMHYAANIDLAFLSVEYIMRDVPNGWFLRYVHANGASMFFIVVYAHIFRGMYYGSYMQPREFLWCSGVILLFLMMGTAFTGYVLPWGQMSFWGATVISNMVTVIPIAGKPIVEWLWGGYTVNNPTLNRFYSVHYVLPFLIAGVSIIHLALLHKEGSNNSIGSDSGIDDIPFYPYFFSKDIFALCCFLTFFAFFVLYFPNFLNHPDNCIPADPLETPAHVVPEWYFLLFYAILRSIPHKAGGIIAMLAAILVLFLLPFLNNSYIRNTTFRPIFKLFFWFFVSDCIILTWIGQMPVKTVYVLIGQIGTIYYFVFFLFLVPLIAEFENVLATWNKNK